MIKRIFCSLLIICMIIPMRASAFVSAYPGLAVYEAAQGSTSTTPIGAGLALLAVGTAIGYFGVGLLFSDGTPNTAVRIPAGTGTVNVPPAPSAPATATPINLNGYSANVFNGSTLVYTGPVVSTLLGAVQASCSGAGTSYSGSNAIVGNNYCDNGFKASTGSASQYCPNGYTQSGSICNLANARQAVPDGKVDYQRSGTTLAPYSGEESGTIPATVFQTTNASDTVQVNGQDASGHPIQFTQQATSTGSTVQVKTQLSDPSGQTYVQTQTYTLDPNGQVQTATQTATNSSLQSASATTTYTDTLAPSGTIAADPASTSSQTPIQFPTDYSREATQQVISSTLNNIKTNTDTLHHDLTDSSAPPNDPVTPDASSFSTSYFLHTFDSLKGWSMPALGNTCPVATFDLTSFFGSGASYTMDYQCTLAENTRSTLSASMVVVFLIAALFIVLGA